MADYANAASGLKARLDLRAKNLAFFESVRSSLFVEVEKANSALIYEGVPTIEYREDTPLELICAGAIATVGLDIMTPAIATTIKNAAGEKSVTFFLQNDETSTYARRASLAPATEAKSTPEEIAAAIIEELIAEAP